MKKFNYLLVCLLLCGCSETVSIQDVTFCKKIPSQRQEQIDNFIVEVNSDYDSYLYSINEAKAVLTNSLDLMNISQSDVENSTYFSVPSDGYVFDLLTLSTSIPWEDSPINDILAEANGNTYIFPTIYYYVFNFQNGGYAIMHADNRYPFPLVYCDNSGEISIDDFCIQDINYTISYDSQLGLYIQDTTTYRGAHTLTDTELLNEFRRICNEIYNCMYSIYHITVNVVDCNFQIYYASECRRMLDSVGISCWYLEDPYIGDDLQTNIHIALLKILVFENYVGELLGQDFDGTTMCSAQTSEVHREWATILYNYITSGVSSPSEMALELLESIGFNISKPGMNYDEEMHQMLHHHHLIIDIQNSHCWSLIDGFKYTESSCAMTSDYSHNCIDHEQNHYQYAFATPAKARFYTTY